MAKLRKTTDTDDLRSPEEASKFFMETIKAAVTTPKSKVVEAMNKAKEERQKNRVKKS